MMLTGTYLRQLDPKGRVCLPADLNIGPAFILSGTPDHALIAMPRDAWERVTEQMAEPARSHWISLSFAVRVQSTGKGGSVRVMLPARLRQWSGLYKGDRAEVLLIGQGEAVLICRREWWQRRQRGRRL